MPVTITHQIDAPDYGQAERHRLQQHTYITLLWSRTQTQDVIACLVRATALSPHILRLRAALKHHALPDKIKAIDRALFEAIIAQRKIIGSTLSDYVQGLFGRHVPWVTKELVAHFLTQVQASAGGGQLMRRSTGMTPSALPVLQIPLPVGSTLREMRASLRRSTKAKLQDLTTHRGRAPRLKARSLARDAAWHYLAMIERQSLYQLAKEYMRTQRAGMGGGYNANALVLRGIRLTAKRLGLPVPKSRLSR